MGIIAEITYRGDYYRRIKADQYVGLPCIFSASLWVYFICYYKICDSTKEYISQSYNAAKNNNLRNTGCNKFWINLILSFQPFFKMVWTGIYIYRFLDWGKNTFRGIFDSLGILYFHNLQLVIE